VRAKIARLQTPITLLEFGQKLMTGRQIRQAHDPRLNAMDYRDGFMIAFLALCAIRLENLAAIIIGQHLTFASGAPRVRFEANEMKSKRALEFDFPADLAQALEFYLKVVHPMLHKGGQLGAPLWPSLHRIQMTEHGIYTRIVQVTQAQLGQPVTPHMFRDAAATFFTEPTPECAMMAAAVLQHADLETTMKHYVHGQQHLAAHKYHDAIGFRGS
jgi:integrase/recombinase XerD